MIQTSRLWAAVALGGSLVGLAVACGSDDDAPAAPSNGTPSEAGTSDVVVTSDGATGNDVATFCAGTLGLYASSYEQCCDEAAAPKKHATDVALLKGATALCSQALAKSVAAGRVTFDASASATCQASVSAYVQARACPDALRSPSNQPARDVFRGGAGCAAVVVGRQGADASCSNDYECADGLTCIGYTPQGDGVCKPPPGDAAPCGYGIPDGSGFIELFRWGFGAHPRCAAGFHCAATALQQGTCKPAQTATGPCDDDEECADGLRCQAGACGTAGPAPASAPCERSSDCQDRLYCKSVDGGRACAQRELAGSTCSNTLGSECSGACVAPDGGSIGARCVAYCGSQ